MNGIETLMDLLRGFGLLGTYSDLLVLGTSNSELSKELYLTLKNKNLRVTNRPDDNSQYDFIFVGVEFNDGITLSKLLQILRFGGIMIVEFNLDYHLRLLQGNMLQLNKRFSLVKG